MNRLTDAELAGLAGFTEGPWQSKNEHDWEEIVGAIDGPDDGRMSYTHVAEITLGIPMGEAELNARLIAAAPAMYAELLERRAMDAVVREALEEIGENTDLPLYSAAAVMELVEALEIARIHVAASAGASHMLEGFGPTRKTRDDLHLQMVDAALAPYREKADAAE